jgi:transcriptional regulator
LDEKGNADSARSDLERAALEKIEEAVEALGLCKGKLTADGYIRLRKRIGHLMDTLFKVGEVLSKAT